MIIFQTSNIPTFLIKMKIMAKIEECMRYAKHTSQKPKNQTNLYIPRFVGCLRSVISGLWLFNGLGYWLQMVNTFCLPTFKSQLYV